MFVATSVRSFEVVYSGKKDDLGAMFHGGIVQLFPDGAIDSVSNVYMYVMSALYNSNFRGAKSLENLYVILFTFWSIQSTYVWKKVLCAHHIK